MKTFTTEEMAEINAEKYLSPAWVTQCIKTEDKNVIDVDVSLDENEPYIENILLTVKKGSVVDTEELRWMLHTLGVPDISVYYTFSVQEQ
jgi:hypothetical protein